LDAICEYYSRTEPASPVPLLLKRARRLAEMSFLEIIGNLAPETLGSIQHITTGPDAESSPPVSS
jgi:type VI secretion system protein ImpA